MQKLALFLGQKNIYRIVLIVVFFYSATAFADSTKHESAFIGAGSLTCAKFAELYRQAPEDAEAIFFQWAQGFMSGLNAAGLIHDTAFHDLSAKTLEAQQSELRAYCDKHPLANYVVAVGTLFQTLPLKQHAITPPSQQDSQRN